MVLRLFYGSTGPQLDYGSVCGSELTRLGTERSTTDYSIETFMHQQLRMVSLTRMEGFVCRNCESNCVLRVNATSEDMNSCWHQANKGRGCFFFAPGIISKLSRYGTSAFCGWNGWYSAGNYYLANDTSIWPAHWKRSDICHEITASYQNAIGRGKMGLHKHTRKSLYFWNAGSRCPNRYWRSNRKRSYFPWLEIRPG